MICIGSSDDVVCSKKCFIFLYPIDPRVGEEVTSLAAEECQYEEDD